MPSVNPVRKFDPSLGLGNRHIQTIFSSVGPRRAKVRKAFEVYKQHQQDFVLNCHDGIRLGGILNLAGGTTSGDKNKLVIIIHGWEGSAESSYMLSLSISLLENGYDVFRLNLRDHGETHHLNEGLFNSTLVPEVISGIADLQSRLNYENYSLIGFSLGGNFALRVAALASSDQLSLSEVIAYCPVLHAGRSNVVLNSAANFVYGQYFIRKWKRSLIKKIESFPQYSYAAELAKMKSLDDMNRTFIPKFTEFQDIDDYFDAYAITGDVMATTLCPCYLHFAEDDMIIPVQDVALLAKNDDLHITVTEKGGHCGYLQNWQFDNWQDQRSLEILSNNKTVK